MPSVYPWLVIIITGTPPVLLCRPVLKKYLAGIILLKIIILKMLTTTALYKRRIFNAAKRA
jgi:hypothetical protein